MIRKLCVALLAALVPVAAATEVSIGANIRTSLRTSRDETPGSWDEERVTTYEIALIPSLIIAPGLGKVEIVPAAGLSVATLSGKRERPGETQEWDTTGVAGGAGCGLFFRLVDGNVFRFSLGPDVWLWLDNPDGNNDLKSEVSVGMPVNIDLMLVRRLFLRISSRLIKIGYEFDRGDERGTFTVFDIQSMWMPELGFYITF